MLPARTRHQQWLFRASQQVQDDLAAPTVQTVAYTLDYVITRQRDIKDAHITEPGVVKCVSLITVSYVGWWFLTYVHHIATEL